jgi:hypothetical protein
MEALDEVYKPQFVGWRHWTKYKPEDLGNFRVPLTLTQRKKYILTPMSAESAGQVQDEEQATNDAYDGNRQQ